MTSDRPQTTSYVQKISLIAGSLSALYAFPLAANAEIIHTNTSLSISSSDVHGTTIDWDIDGDNTIDFRLTIAKDSSSSSNWIGINSASKLTREDRSLVNNGLVFYGGSSSNWGLADLPSGVEIPNSLSLEYFLNSSAPLMFSSPRPRGIAEIQANFEDGIDGYFGFLFDISGNSHYGWAKINLDIDRPNSTVTIKEWAYESTPEASITVGDTGEGGTKSTPEPLSTLALLSLGAAGVYRWRKRKQDLAEAENLAA